MDAVLAPTKRAVLAKVVDLKHIGPARMPAQRCVGQGSYNASSLTLVTLLNDHKHLAESLAGYLRRLSRDGTW